MTEKKHTAIVATEKTRTENCIGFFGQKNIDQLEKVLGMVFEIGVMDYRELRIHMGEGCPNGRGFPLIHIMAQKKPFQLASAGMLAGETKAIERLGSPVRGAIVDDNDFDPLEKR